ncbi:MAG: B12-binding domain-containing radical SAM protein [bacterium]|nr:B12-binding domain-containing radical SAM protein [bacterium]
MNLLFTTSAAPEKNSFATSEKRPPLGVGSLMAVCREAGHNIHFIDNYLAPTGFPSDGYLDRHDIDAVAIYSNTICFRDTERMCEELEALRRAGRWTGKIMVGGPHTSAAIHTVPDCVDHVVEGEGEHTLIDILEGRETARIIKGRKVTDLDALPFQPWDIFAKLPYHRTCPWMDLDEVHTMNTSRGCPFKCTFCSVFSVWGTKYSVQSGRRIVDEMDLLMKDYGAEGFYFREDHFTLSRKRTEEFCRILIDRGAPAPWACETRVDSLSEEVVKMMADAGCAAVYLGIESGTQRMLDLMKKNITVSHIENSINYCRKYGIHAYCSLLVGVPGETFEDFLATQALMERLQPYSYAYNVFVGIPTSALYEQVLAEKSYEYMDDLGLLYPRGFDVKTRAFYRKDASCFVDYKFRERTEFDRRLMAHLHRQKWAGRIHRLKTMIPEPGARVLGAVKRAVLRAAPTA